MKHSPRSGFGPERRLHTQADFDRAFQSGRRVVGRHMSVRAAANGLEHARLGVVVGRRFAPAAARNRIRRLVREAFRLRQHDLPAPCDLVVAPRRPWREPGVEELAEELVELVGQALSGRQGR